MFERCAQAPETEAMFDQRLDEAAAEQAHAHMASCDVCRSLFAELGELRATLKGAADAPNVFAMKRLRRQVLSAGETTTTKTPARPWWRWARLLVPVVTVILAVFGAVSLWPRSNVADVTVTAGPGARFMREAVGQNDVVRLTDGEFEFDVRTHASGRRLFVIVPDGEIEDIGTRFRVVVDDGVTTEITVSEGEVEFRRAGAAPLRLIAGMSYRPVTEQVASASASATPVVEAPTVATSTPAQRPSAPPPAQSHARMATPTHGVGSAIATSTAELSTAPGGATAEDLAYMRVIRAMRAGETEQARALARQYLNDFPHGLRRAEMTSLGSSPP